jgi:succinate dehydrogenase/fumarate reductase flavoprotein subunit
MEMLTAGARAGWAAGDYAVARSQPNVDQTQESQLIEQLLAPLSRKTGVNPIEVRKQLQEKSQALMGPVRTADGLNLYLDYLLGLRQDVLPQLSAVGETHQYNKSWFEALDLVNMVDAMEACCRAALHRQESRGVHYREDFPFVDNDEWLQQIMVTMADGGYQLATRPVNTSLMAPPAGKTPYMDFIKTMMAAHSDIGGHH